MKIYVVELSEVCYGAYDAMCISAESPEQALEYAKEYERAFSHPSAKPIISEVDPQAPGVILANYSS